MELAYCNCLNSSVDIPPGNPYPTGNPRELAPFLSCYKKLSLSLAVPKLEGGKGNFLNSFVAILHGNRYPMGNSREPSPCLISHFVTSVEIAKKGPVLITDPLMILPVLTVSTVPYQVCGQTGVRTT